MSKEGTMDTTTQLRTASGEYVIFHSSQAAQPDVFEDADADPERGPGWYFEPTDYPENTVFSTRHETPEAARVAAEAWEAEEQRDADYEAGRLYEINNPVTVTGVRSMSYADWLAQHGGDQREAAR